MVTEDDFTWKLPKPTSTATVRGRIEEGDDKHVLKYVGGVDVSFSKDDPSVACGTIVVLDLGTLEVVYDDYSVVRLQTPYVPGFLALREVCPFPNCQFQHGKRKGFGYEHIEISILLLGS